MQPAPGAVGTASPVDHMIFYLGVFLFMFIFFMAVIFLLLGPARAVAAVRARIAVSFICDKIKFQI